LAFLHVLVVFVSQRYPKATKKHLAQYFGVDGADLLLQPGEPVSLSGLCEQFTGCLLRDHKFIEQLSPALDPRGLLFDLGHQVRRTSLVMPIWLASASRSASSNSAESLSALRTSSQETDSLGAAWSLSLLPAKTRRHKETPGTLWLRCLSRCVLAVGSLSGESGLPEPAAHHLEVAPHGRENLGAIDRELTSAGVGSSERILEMQLHRA
jgi:hypothetical protein